MGTFFITSNRDEHISRPSSYEPKKGIVNKCKVYFPKDPKAGGTWIAVNEMGVGAVLLNGAFEKHIPTGNYQRSRGLILLEVVSSKTPYQHLEVLNLDSIEPFTIIIFDGKTLLEFRWDGNLKYHKNLDIQTNHIWSSATLYSKVERDHRKQLFDRFITTNEVFDENLILEFHSNNHNDFENGFVINRDETLRTFSITQLVFTSQNVKLNHHDLLKEERQTLNV